MTLINKSMTDFLKENGINAHAKYCSKGSMRGTWRIYSKNIQWYNNIYIQSKMKSLGFKNFRGEELTNISGNGGILSLSVTF
jgi:hypothetical protein